MIDKENLSRNKIYQIEIYIYILKIEPDLHFYPEII